MRSLISLHCASNPQDSPGLASQSEFEAWHHAGSHFSEPSARLWSQKKADGWFAHARGWNQPSADPCGAAVSWKCLHQPLSNENRAIANQNHLGCLLSCWFLFTDEAGLCAVMSKQHAGKQGLINLSWNSCSSLVRRLTSQVLWRLHRLPYACIHPKVSITELLVYLFLSCFFFLQNHMGISKGFCSLVSFRVHISTASLKPESAFRLAKISDWL